MKFINYKISLLFFLIQSILFWCGCSDDNQEQNDISKFEKIDLKIGGAKTQVSLGYYAEGQKSEERNWKKIEIKKKLRLGSIEETTFDFPTQIRSDSYGNIYVLDMGGDAVKKFSPEGKFIKQFGREGRGPGEFHSPFRIDLRPDGKLLVLDPNLNKCEVFTKDGVKQVLLKYQPLGISFKNDNEFCILQVMNPLDDSAIRKYTIDNNDVTDFQNILYSESFDSVTVGMLPFLTGDLFSDDDECIYYVPYYMNHIIKYNSEGEIEFARKTIEDVSLNSYERPAYNAVSFRLPKEQQSAYRTMFVDDMLYLISSREIKKTKEGTEYVVDGYSTLNGDYQYSFKMLLNFGIGDIHMNKENIYLVKQNASIEVLEYKLK
ncbi:MAG: 6-bladed beta-propeller [Melioribacteraceae bacterium]|nr:6-bladed beta-propeller [Melioribacteraceae bacterium]MCF8420970.1 6-bladed beta-propeller [Melioribacteraceae bacterium]